MFTTPMLLTAGATIIIAVLDKVSENLHLYWLNTLLKLILPIVGIAFAIYFLETNPLLRWLK